MQIKAEEISSIIQEKIKGFDQRVDVNERGYVIQVGDNIAKVYGLEGAMSGELLEFPGNLFGVALNLEEYSVGAVLLGEGTGIREGDPCRNIILKNVTWKPYKKVDDLTDIQKMMKEGDKHFLTLEDFCLFWFPKSKYTDGAVGYFISNMKLFTKANQIWVHKMSTIK